VFHGQVGGVAGVGRVLLRPLDVAARRRGAVDRSRLADSIASLAPPRAHLATGGPGAVRSCGGQIVAGLPASCRLTGLTLPLSLLTFSLPLLSLPLGLLPLSLIGPRLPIAALALAALLLALALSLRLLGLAVTTDARSLLTRLTLARLALPRLRCARLSLAGAAAG